MRTMAEEKTTSDGSELMLQAAMGDENAFEKLVSIFHKSVINTIYRYLGDAALAEDLAQDVFLKIYKARKRYKPLAKFETWLHRIVYNVVVNEAQSRARRTELSLEVLRERGWEERGGGRNRFSGWRRTNSMARSVMPWPTCRPTRGWS